MFAHINMPILSRAFGSQATIKTRKNLNCSSLARRILKMNSHAPSAFFTNISSPGTAYAPTLTEIVVSQNQYIFRPVWCLFGYIAFAALQPSLNKLRGADESADEDYQPRDMKSSNTIFKDVKVVDQAKAELEEISDYLRNPEVSTRLGGRLPRGVLLVGSPGTGKTMLARALGTEADVPFFAYSASKCDEITVEELFKAAKEKSPSIIFIDDIDAVGDTAVNQLLAELDVFEENDSVIVIGATNSPDSLDEALVRAGRFDHQVAIPMPNVKGRREVLESYMSRIVAADSVNVGVIARGTTRFSAADLAQLVNIAAVKAAVDGSKQVTMADLEHAKGRIIMGTERKSEIKFEEVQKYVAVHESGHALVAIYADGAFRFTRLRLQEE